MLLIWSIKCPPVSGHFIAKYPVPFAAAPAGYPVRPPSVRREAPFLSGPCFFRLPAARLTRRRNADQLYPAVRRVSKALYKSLLFQPGRNARRCGLRHPQRLLKGSVPPSSQCRASRTPNCAIVIPMGRMALLALRSSASWICLMSPPQESCGCILPPPFFLKK